MREDNLFILLYIHRDGSTEDLPLVPVKTHDSSNIALTSLVSTLIPVIASISRCCVYRRSNMSF
jgi:hypothetical protein